MAAAARTKREEARRAPHLGRGRGAGEGRVETAWPGTLGRGRSAVEGRAEAAWPAAGAAKSGGATSGVAVRPAKEGMRRRTAAQRPEDGEGREDVRRGGGGIGRERDEGSNVGDGEVSGE